MTFGSLFAGIGGFDLGLERAGMKPLWQVEIDPWARKVLAKHWPDVQRYEDVCTVGTQNLEPVDVLCGGFPCQDISNAGKRAGIEGERSGLWGEYARIICELRPRYVIVENVAALLARGLDVVLRDLAEIGYDAEWDIISAAAVGAPHRRERVWIVAYPDQQGLEDAGAKRLPQGRQTPVGHVGSSSPRDGATHWAAEPDVGRVVDGIPKRVDRLRGLGNAVVPQVVEWIGHRIMQQTSINSLREGLMSE
jgi:DNA (cytosine-5)-methyltransferase 1